MNSNSLWIEQDLKKRKLNSQEVSFDDCYFDILTVCLYLGSKLTCHLKFCLFLLVCQKHTLASLKSITSNHHSTSFVFLLYLPFAVLIVHRIELEESFLFDDQNSSSLLADAWEERQLIFPSCYDLHSSLNKIVNSFISSSPQLQNAEFFFGADVNSVQRSIERHCTDRIVQFFITKIVFFTNGAYLIQKTFIFPFLKLVHAENIRVVVFLARDNQSGLIVWFSLVI